MGAGNKVRFNLKNAHYAILTVSEGGVLTFEKPIPLPGAVSLSLSAEGDTSPFYADGIVYYQSTANNGYSGDLELALIPDGFRKSALGEMEDETGKVLYERADVEPRPFALLFQFDGDKKGIRHIIYNCTAFRPGLEGGTQTDSKEPATETISMTAPPLENGLVKAKTSDSTPDAVYKAWFEEVWMPSQVSA